MQWDDDQFVQVADWLEPLDPPFIRQLIEESAANFAADNGITPRECS